MQRFSYHELHQPLESYQHCGDLKRAAVLIPLIFHKHGIDVVLTKRAEHLKHHPGQISFPGGKAEDFDKDLQETALREATEEIGLPADVVDIIGQLKQYQTISGYTISPFIAAIPNNYPFTIDQNEVAEIFTVPFSHFIDEGNHVSFEVNRGKTKHNIHFMPYLNYNIWGATAAILKDLVLHLK